VPLRQVDAPARDDRGDECVPQRPQNWAPVLPPPLGEPRPAALARILSGRLWLWTVCAIGLAFELLGKIDQNSIDVSPALRRVFCHPPVQGGFLTDFVCVFHGGRRFNDLSRADQS
jgi:hypothetical protein